jgi:hypothetical protein
MRVYRHNVSSLYSTAPKDKLSLAEQQEWLQYFETKNKSKQHSADHSSNRLRD